MMNTLPWEPFAPFMGTDVDISDGCVVAIGVFDGVHRGHQELIARAREDAVRRGVPCVALTFDPDPAEVLGVSEAAQRLLTTPDRVSGLHAAGADKVVVLNFTQQLACQTPRAFVERHLAEALHPVSVHVGSNFRFGHKGSGTAQTLADLGEDAGFAVHTHDLINVTGKAVSSTRIRELLQEGGRLSEANALLGRCHYVRGVVKHGRGEGTSFGFPTANVVSDLRDCMPAEGVYACYVTCGSRAWPAAANVGAPPTFSEHRPAFLEANLIGFSGDLYGAEVSVSFVSWLRGSRKFDSLEELEKTVLGNIDWVRQSLGDHELEVKY